MCSYKTTLTFLPDYQYKYAEGCVNLTIHSINPVTVINLKGFNFIEVIQN